MLDLRLKSIRFLGHPTEIDKGALQILCYAVTLLYSLRSKAFGISLLWGAIFGKPIISSKIRMGRKPLMIYPTIQDVVCLR